MAIKSFKIEVAIEEAFKEFSSLSDDKKNGLQIMLIARKYAPQGSKQVLDCISENPAMLYLENKPGFLQIDSLIASVTEVIASRIMQTHQESVAKLNSDATKSEAIRSKLRV